jgi:predicted HicB family RNase H-like nuclease
MAMNQRVAISISDELHAKLKIAAKKAGISMAQYIRDATRELNDTNKDQVSEPIETSCLDN